MRRADEAERSKGGKHGRKDAVTWLAGFHNDFPFHNRGVNVPHTMRGALPGDTCRRTR